MGQPWLEDPTNGSPRFLRNRIRSRILPALEEVSPGAVRAVARSASLLSGWRDVADGVTEIVLEELLARGTMTLREYATLPPVLRLGALWAVSGRPRGGRTELEKADRWLCRGAKGEHPLPGGGIVVSDGDRASILGSPGLDKEKG